MATTYAKDFFAQRAALDAWGRNRKQLEEHAALAHKLNEQAREEWDNPIWQRQVAADIASSLDYGFTFDNYFSTYFQTEVVGEFDRVVMRERRGLKVYYTARGGYIDESQITTEEWELPRDTLGFHVSENTDKLRANFATAIGDIVSLGQQRLEAEVNRRIFSTLQAAVPSSSSYYVTAASLTASVLNDAIRVVRDAIKPNGQGPVPVTVMGRASVIDKISDFDMGFDPEATAEIRARGRLGVYRGASVNQLFNYTDEDDKSYIPGNELWVFGGTVGKFAMYGGLTVKSWEENTVDYTHYRARRDVGGLVVHPEQARRIVVGDVSA